MLFKATEIHVLLGKAYARSPGDEYLNKFFSEIQLQYPQKH